MEVFFIILNSFVVKAYSAQQISHFKYFDDLRNSLRKFVAVTFPIKGMQRRPLLVEEFTSGPLTVYRRLHHSRGLFKLKKLKVYDANDPLPEDIDSFDYFVVEGNSFVNLNNFAQLLWPRMRAQFQDVLQDYVAVRNLNLHDTTARLMLINRYNYLKLQSITAGGDELTNTILTDQ